jgi:hypothetical protein
MDENQPVAESTDQSAPSLSIPRGERGFRVVELRTDVQGIAHVAERHFLPEKVYQRSTAIKWTAYEAKRFSPEVLIVVVDPGGRGVAVLHGGTGKPAKPLVSLRAKRAVAEILPGAKRRRRTSRPASKATPTRRKTSKPARKR